MKSDAQTAYEGYAGFTGGMTFDGRPMPEWEQLPERIRLAWAAALDAVPTARFAEGALSFGAALIALKNDARVRRAGWNGKGMWLQLIRADQWTISMRTADGKDVPWLASQTDLLAEDWSVLP